MAEGLTPKQQAFVDEYLIDRNGTQAAIRCGYSSRTANEQASRLLANVKIQGAVAQGILAARQRAEITADTVLQGAFAEALGQVIITKQLECPSCKHISKQQVVDTSPSARVSAFTLIAKMQGYITDRAIIIPEDLARVLADTKQIMADVVADESIPRTGIMAEVDVRLMEEARRRGHQG